MAIPNWVTISQNQGGAKLENTTTTITITADTYSGLVERTGVLTINTVNTGLSATVNLIQEEKKYFYWSGTTSSAKTVYVDYTDTGITEYFTTNYNIIYDSVPVGDIVYTGQSTDFQTYYTINFEENTSLSDRTSRIDFYSDNTKTDLVGQLTIVQRAKRDYSSEYLTFEITSAGNIKWDSQNQTTRKISYSKDNGSTWKEITSTKGGTSISVNSGDIVFFKGANTFSYGFYGRFKDSTAGFKVYGNTMSLFYGDDFIGKTSFPSANVEFSNQLDCLFEGCTGLTDASNLILPATTLKKGCYDGMFLNCKNLTTVPELPATTLAESCYDGMFSKCTSLVNAPELPATTLAKSCYNSMFFYCTSLVNTPELPATTLAESCYQQMFYHCTSLVNAPELPATTLANWCYNSMFGECSSLVTAPSILPATTLTPGCCQKMFLRCTSLVNAPELPATTLANYCYEHMFQECTSLVNAPALPSTTLTPGCYQGMFYICRSLVTAPDLPATTLANYCYGYMLQSCSSLNYIKCLATDISATDCIENWVSGVASTGTFVKKSGVSWPTGISGIPEGWTVETV